MFTLPRGLMMPSIDVWPSSWCRQKREFSWFASLNPEKSLSGKTIKILFPRLD